MTAFTLLSPQVSGWDAVACRAVPCMRGARQRGLWDGGGTLLAAPETACLKPGERLVDIGKGATGGHRTPHKLAQPAPGTFWDAAGARAASANCCLGVMECQ